MEHKLAAEFIQALITNTTKEFLMKQAGINPTAKVTPAEVILMARAACAAITILNDSVCPLINEM